MLGIYLGSMHTYDAYYLRAMRKYLGLRKEKIVKLPVTDKIWIVA